VHEFDFDEFRGALEAVFPHVTLFLENHVEGVTFQPHQAGHTVETRVDAGDPLPAESHFFVAVCAHRPQLGNPTFVYVPRAANVLRERERHIALLDAEVAQKNQWLEKLQQDLAEFERQQQKLLGELEQSNQWADALHRELQERRARVDELQQELAREQENAQRQILELEQDLARKIEWARQIDATLKEEVAEKKEAVDLLHQAESELAERTAWAQRLEAELARISGQLALYQTSRWVKLGKKVGLGPEFPAT
jgi:hypothetical protein